MASSDRSELAFFSHDIGHALDVHAAELTGSMSPSLLIRDAELGKQAFPGSLVRLDDGQTYVVDLSGGVYKGTDGAVCLQLKPLAGGPAKRWYPKELAQSVQEMLLGCLSSHDFSTQAPSLKQGSAAAKGIFTRDDAKTPVRLVWRPEQKGIMRYSQDGKDLGAAALDMEQVSTLTSAASTPWAQPPANLDPGAVNARGAAPCSAANVISYLTKTVWARGLTGPSDLSEVDSKFATDFGAILSARFGELEKREA